MSKFDRPTEIIFELARAVASEMRASYPTWKEAFLRMQAGDGFFETKCSIVLPDSVQILDVLAHQSFVSQAQQLGSELREKLPRPNGPLWLSILRVSSNLTCDMQYEYSDPNRWRISKIGGGTGLPVGYIPA